MIGAERLTLLAIIFRVVVWVCGFFFLLTIIAMLLYPGGSVSEPNSQGYNFFLNFFSDLGQTHVGYGASNAVNLPSMFLFGLALTTIAGGMVMFFVAFSLLFRQSTVSVWLSRIAALCGAVTAVCFVGVAFTPWNLFLQAHNGFVQWAFRLFLAAVVLLIIAIAFEPRFPRHFLYIFAGFAVVLAAYVLLLTFGPATSTPQGSAIQATGQKIIVYASILTVFIQSLSAGAMIKERTLAAPLMPTT
ncbi:MAG TPA: hypothetical protein VKR99_07035 [Candidatus Eremiobacteraceae bacterium]|nr:hypothetical protein [Candidatus Eremiobacteraceae bacterium]